MPKPFFSGLGTGMVLQPAIGPVFFYILGITLDSGLFNGFLAVLAVTMADYFYILLSLAGIGSLLEHERAKKYFRSNKFNGSDFFRDVHGLQRPC